MRNYKKEWEDRVAFIRQTLRVSGAGGIVYGNSGGKDSALTGILCKAACADTLGLILPCSSQRNFQQDKDDAMEVAKQFHIETRVVDLTPVRDAELRQLTPAVMMLAGTGNASETYMGYFTKWGDGACDFNPIADLTVTEVYEFLEYLGAPRCILEKEPSAALFDGQTDEGEMGITYREIDEFLLNGTASERNRDILQRYHSRSAHKRHPILRYEA